MYQSSTRNNFLDILLDPTAIGILVSIALHALLGGYLLPIFTKSQPDVPKVEPGTVKVVELTASELQRIPQAPEPTITPAPSQQVLPPIDRPNTTVAPSTPQISTSPQFIPISPVRTTLQAKITKSSKPSKSQQAKPQPQPSAPVFNPDISFKPSKSPVTQVSPANVTPQPQVKPSQIPTKPTNQPSTTPAPQSQAGNDNNSDPSNSPNHQPSTPISQQPTIAPSSSPQPKLGSPISNPPTDAPADNGNINNNLYGKYAQAASERLTKYISENPGLKIYPPTLLSQQYPVGAICSRAKQPPFIVLMVAFGKVPENQDSNVLGETTAPSIDKPYVAGDRDTPENRKLAELAANNALFEANKADQNRPEADKNKPVLYQYRVQFDPASCKN